MFVVGLVATYSTMMAMAINNVTGLRGPRLAQNPFVHANQDFADLVCLLLLSAAVVVISLLRKRLHLRGELLAGMWVALALAGLVLMVR